MFNKRFEQLRHYFGIIDAADWRDVKPEWILGQDRCGPKILDYIRLLLANHGIVLKDDKTPEHWKQHISEVEVLDPLGDPEEPTTPQGIINPFTILIDTAEEHAYSFAGITADADRQYRQITVPFEWQCLGRHPNSFGDYSIAGHLGRISIERKSMDDAHGTFLGWKEKDSTGTSRRERFESELSNLNECYRGHIVVECSQGDLLRNAPEWGTKTAAENSKILSRTIIAWRHRFPKVQWHFCDDRRMAEITVFRTLERYWEDEVIEKQREEQRELRASKREARTAANEWDLAL